jgi:hypothetical protein
VCIHCGKHILTDFTVQITYKHIHNCHKTPPYNYLAVLITLSLSISGVKLLSLRPTLLGLLFLGGLGEREIEEEYRLRLAGGGERESEGDLRRGGGEREIGLARLGGGVGERESDRTRRGGERESDRGRRGGERERDSDLGRPARGGGGGGLSSYLILPPLPAGASSGCRRPGGGGGGGEELRRRRVGGGESSRLELRGGLASLRFNASCFLSLVFVLDYDVNGGLTYNILPSSSAFPSLHIPSS